MDPYAVDVAEGVRRLGLQQWRRADAALAAWLKGEPEGLHDFRVALRRLRSLVEAFAPDLRLKGALRRRLKRLARHTNAAREAEVAVEQVRGWLDHLPETERGPVVEWLSRLEAERDESHEELQATLPRLWRRSGRRVAKALELIQPRDEALRFAPAAARRIREHADGLRLALARIGGLKDGVALHRARIQAKRLRYLVEPFRKVTDNARLAVDSLKALQDELGALHDLDELHQRASRAMTESCRTQVAAWADALFYEASPSPFCPPPLAGLVRALGEAYRCRYSALEAFGEEAGRWHGEAVSVAAVLEVPPTMSERKNT